MNLEEKYRKEDAQFVVIPRPIEGEVSYGKGAKNGPDAIIKASEQLEYYDEEFDQEPFLKGIKITDSFTGEQFPIFLGGDHSITIEAVKEVESHHDFSVIVLDAHPDCFHSWNGSQNNHRCVAQRVSEKHDTLIVGVRSMDKDEVEVITNNENIDVIKAYDYNEVSLKEKISKLKDKVYISIDVDVFDPSFIRQTGTPEPGGFFWNEVMEILKIIYKEKNVIGADIVEFAPKEDEHVESYCIAKLAHKLMALKLTKGA